MMSRIDRNLVAAILGEEWERALAAKSRAASPFPPLTHERKAGTIKDRNVLAAPDREAGQPGAGAEQEQA